MSTSDPPRPTSTTPPTRFTASLDKLSSTTRNSSKSSFPGDIAIPDLPLKSLHTLLVDVVTTTLPSALSLFLVIYLSSPHTRTDGLRGYVPVGIVVGRVVGEVGRRRLGLAVPGRLGEYGMEEEANGVMLGPSSGAGDTNVNVNGDDLEKQDRTRAEDISSTSVSTSPSSPSSSPSSSPTKSPTTSSSSTTPTRFRGRKAEILSGALEAALVLGLSLAVSGSGNGSGGNTGLGLGLLSFIGTPRPNNLNPILLLVSLITTYTSYTLYGGANGSEWTTVMGALGVVLLDAGRRWAGLGAARGNLGVGTAIALTTLGTILIHPLNAPTLAAIFVMFFVILVFALNPPKLVSSPGPKQKTVYRELAVCTGLLGVLQEARGGMWVLAGMFGLGWVVARQDSQHIQQQQQLLGEQQKQTQDQHDDGASSAKRSRWARSVAGIVAFVAVMTSLWRSPGLGMGTIRGELGVVTGPNWRADVDFELALSHYDEPVEGLADTIRYVQDGLPRMSSSRVTVYSKKLEGSDRHGLQRLLRETKADEVVALANVGREGETYLQHIARRYSNPRAPLARQTFFLQPHLAWDWVAKPRLKEVYADTGFISFGPYLNASCTGDGSEKDSHGMSFPRISQIYAMFNGDLCPSTGFTVTWAGQFLASRKRIQDVPLQTYLNLLGYFDVEPNSDDPKAWIWKEQWWNAKPSDPTLGHWLERSWPSVFRCSQLDLADCGEQPGELCQCRDRVD